MRTIWISVLQIEILVSTYAQGGPEGFIDSYNDKRCVFVCVCLCVHVCVCVKNAGIKIRVLNH